MPPVAIAAGIGAVGSIAGGAIASSGAKKAAKTASEQRIAHRAAKERMKTRGEWTKDAQTAFNDFIRARDSGAPCVSCGRHHQG